MSTKKANRLAAFLPFLNWWPMVGRDTIKTDMVAGLSGALIVLPQAVAFATIAGLPPQYGLYAAMMPAVVAALFGSSWHLVSGPTTAISIALFAAIHNLAEPGTPEYIGLALILTFQVGVFQAALGIARLGALVNFISHTVVIGFTAGAAVLIASSQIKNFFGQPIPRGLHFYEVIQQFFILFDQINWLVTAVGAITLATGIITKRYFKKFPYMIAAMLVGSVVATILNTMLGGTAQTGIKTVGALPSGLPPLSMPDFSFAAIKATFAPALVITMLALTEAVSIARAIATRSEQRIDGNQEFIGQGLSNIVGSFFSGYAASGSFNRSGVNYEAGARTPLASVFASIFLVIVLLLVAPLAAYLPNAAMGGILFLVAWGLIDFHHIGSMWKTSKAEAVVLWVTLIGTLLNLELGIFAGIIVSLMMYLYRTSRPAVVPVVPVVRAGSYHFEDAYGKPECPQLRMVRINGSLYFGAVEHVQGALLQIDEDNPLHKTVLVVGSNMNFVDVAGAEMLAQEARRRRRMGGGLYFYRLKDSIYKFLHQGDYLKDIGNAGFFPVGVQPTSSIYYTLDPDVCRRCKNKVFSECQGTVLPDGDRRLRMMLATDGTEFAAAPQAAALGLASQMGVTLDVLAVGGAREAQARFDAVIRPAAEKDVPLEPVLRDGADPAKEVIAATKAADTHLLVMGRRPGAGGRLVGDNASRIIAGAPSHVLVVPQGAGMWQKRILVAFDGSAVAETAAGLAGTFAKAGKLPVTLLAICDGPLSEEMDDALKQMVGNLKSEGVEADIRVVSGAPAAAILKAAEDVGADLLVLGRPARSALNRALLGSVTDQVIGQSRHPVLIVKGEQVQDLSRDYG